MSRKLGSILGVFTPTILTILSFSTVATNVHVRAGGAYHIISRSLGIEIGGVILLAVPVLLVSLTLALGVVYLGNLNAVAAVVTMFFLSVYGTVNLVAAFAALSGDPSWRPRLRAP